MKQQSTIKMIIIVSLTVALTAGIANAATRDIVLKLGGKVGDLFKLPGILQVDSLRVVKSISSTTKNKPVRVADDLRIDGKISAGETAASGDVTPVVINEDLRIKGNLNVDGNVTASQLTLADLLGSSTTTWSGTVYDVCNTYSGNVTSTMQTGTITVTFSPTSQTEGTWTSTPYNIFRLVECSSSESLMPKGNYSGSYRIIETALFATSTKYNNTAVPSYNIIPQILGGNKMSVIPLASIPAAYTELTKQ